MTNALLTTKLHIPPLLPQHVSRPRLVRRLEEALRLGRKLTLVSAPAGYGKTTLVSSWAQQSHIPVAWLSLDLADDCSLHFLRYLIAALQSLEPGLGSGVAQALDSPQSPDSRTVLPALLNEWAAVDHPLVLVLDDYHVIEASAIHDLMAFVLDHLPPRGHVVIVSRTQPPLPLARLRARGRLIELGANDLRFSPEETRRFVIEMMGLSLAPDSIEALLVSTEGWAAGLQMALVSMQGRDDPHDVAQALSGRQRFIYDYLFEEVFGQQSPDVQRFLLHTSILDRLSGSLCEAVAEPDGTTGQRMLERLEGSNLFTVPLDGERHWYRYHVLWAELLRERLDRTAPGMVRVLHRRASRWYNAIGETASAIEHALLAGDGTLAAQWIDDKSTELWGRGRHGQLARWLNTLPTGEVAARPRLGVLNALLQSMAGDHRAALASLEQTGGAACDELQGVVAAAQAFMALHRGDFAAAQRCSQQAIACLPAEALVMRSSAEYTLGLTCRLQGHLNTAQHALTTAVAAGEQSDSQYIVMLARLNLAIVHVQRGQLRDAAQILRQALRQAKQEGMDGLPVAGLLHAELSTVLLQWNDVDKAIQAIERGLSLVRQGQDAQGSVRCHVILGLAYLAQEDWDAVDDAVRALEMLVHDQTGLSWARYWIISLQIQAALARSHGEPQHLETAACLVEVYHLDAKDDLPYLGEIAYLALARLLVAQGQRKAAYGLLDRLQQAFEVSERRGWVISTLVHQAMILQALGDSAQAVKRLGKALTLGQPEGYIRVFVEHGPGLVPLLCQAANQGIAVAYAARLLRVLEGQSGSQQPRLLVDPLSPREMEVLRLLPTELTVQEMAAKLSVAKSTIRSRSKSIYSKLDVHSRWEAVRRAEKLSLL